MFKRQDIVHEINHLIASYRQLVHAIGTQSDSMDNREELTQCRQQCLKSCDSAKNCILPQLKGETADAHTSSEFTKQANQFIGCVNMFVLEMKRCNSLLHRFPGVSVARRNSTDDTDPSPSRMQMNGEMQIDQELESLNRDLSEAERILEALENAITVHFSTRDQMDMEKAVLSSRSRRKGCQFSKLCSNFKTSYA